MSFLYLIPMALTKPIAMTKSSYWPSPRSTQRPSILLTKIIRHLNNPLRIRTLTKTTIRFLERHFRASKRGTPTVKTMQNSFKVWFQHRVRLQRMPRTHLQLNSALQKTLPANIQNIVLYIAHNPRLQGHLCSSRIFNKLRREFYCQFISNDVFYAVPDCQSWAQDRGMLRKSKKHLLLFPANSSFEFLAMYILVPLPKNNCGKRFKFFIAVLYPNITWAIPMNDTTAPLVTACFFKNWVFPQSILYSILTYTSLSLPPNYYDT